MRRYHKEKEIIRSYYSAAVIIAAFIAALFIVSGCSAAQLATATNDVYDLLRRDCDTVYIRVEMIDKSNPTAPIDTTRKGGGTQ